MSNFFFKSEIISERELDIYDARRAPLRLFGLYKPEREGKFERLPKDVADKTNERVSLLYSNTAGARLRFVTDSDFLAIGAICPSHVFPSPTSAAMIPAGSSFFDLYIDGHHKWVLAPKRISQKGAAIGFDLSDGRYEVSVDLGERRRRSITLCFPSFIDISEVYIGVTLGATVEECEPYRNELPVVFYGSSITQGSCASRSGNTYENILSRRLNFDYVNLGFAGACHAEAPMVDYLCTLPMSVLVFDYDHNCPSAEYLENTHLSALRKLRAAHPKVPIILMSKPNVHNGRDEAVKRMRVIERSYEALLGDGCDVYFVNGLDVFDSRDSEMMTTDGTHPTDFGFYCMAEALMPIFKKIFD